MRRDEKPAVVPSSELIPEVVQCRFEYFDGAAWLADWRADRKQPPRAVRISLRVISAAELEEMRTSRAGTGEERHLKDQLAELRQRHSSEAVLTNCVLG